MDTAISPRANKQKDTNNFKVSTTDNPISGDGVLTAEEIRLWMMYNVGLYFEAEVSLENHWNLKVGRSEVPSLLCDMKQTPLRIVCNLMWENMPVKSIEEELGDVRILDIGCGSGRYFSMLDKVFKSVTSYTGVDVKRHRKFSTGNDPRASLILSPAEKIDPAELSKHNFYVSQSSMEHIPEELRVLRALADAVRGSGRPTIHVHVIPAPLMFRQYGCHGFRGFNSRMIQEIYDLYSDFSQCCVYTLGGKAINDVHFKYSYDAFNRSRENSLLREGSNYVPAVRNAIAADFGEDHISIRDAGFLALIIHSNPTRRIFSPSAFLG